MLLQYRRILRAVSVTRLRKLQIPSAMPQVFIGLQTAAGLSVVGAVVGDFFFGRGSIGLGLLLQRYSSRLQSAEMLATVLAACALGLIAFWLFGALGRRICLGQPFCQPGAVQKHAKPTLLRLDHQGVLYIRVSTAWATASITA